jgi:hypothetical protein
MASACCLIKSSLMLSANVFHELQPIVGVHCASAAVATNSISKMMFLRMMSEKIKNSDK